MIRVICVVIATAIAVSAQTIGQTIESDARKFLSAGPFTIVNKQVTPPSGDKHDYMSQAPYWWPDPKTPYGLPYIRRDGERNPEIDKITEHRVMAQMEKAVETLARAYRDTGNQQYSAKAVELLRVFFLNPETRMNPNLEFAQGIPGINTGRGQLGEWQPQILFPLIDRAASHYKSFKISSSNQKISFELIGQTYRVSAPPTSALAGGQLLT